MKNVLLLAAAFAFAAPAFAQVTQPAPPAPQVEKASPTSDQFVKIDADASGSLSLGEIKVVDTTVTQADFDKYDADHNKAISKAEFTKWQSAKAMKPAAPTPG
jgi:biopolymer transport protein ExbD